MSTVKDTFNEAFHKHLKQCRHRSNPVSPLRLLRYRPAGRNGKEVRNREISRLGIARCGRRCRAHTKGKEVTPDETAALNRDVELHVFLTDCGEQDAIDRRDSVYRRKPRDFAHDRNLTPLIFARIFAIDNEKIFGHQVYRLMLNLDVPTPASREYALWYALTAPPESVCRAAIAVCREAEPSEVDERMAHAMLGAGGDDNAD